MKTGPKLKLKKLPETVNLNKKQACPNILPVLFKDYVSILLASKITCEQEKPLVSNAFT